MKNMISIVGVLGLLSLSVPASADRWSGARNARVVNPGYSVTTERYAQARTEYDFAEVVAVDPVVRLVTVTVPSRECWDEEVVVDRRRRGGNGSAGSAIAGGLLGGLVGRQIGGGSGRDAMTVVGAIVGSAIGSNASRNTRTNDDVRYDTVRRCETRDEVRQEERVDGYNVTYIYNGREYTTRTRNHPGERLRVRVSVNPAGRY